MGCHPRLPAERAGTKGSKHSKRMYNTVSSIRALPTLCFAEQVAAAFGARPRTGQRPARRSTAYT